MMPHPPEPISVVLADDHKLVRSGIVSLLSSIEGVSVVGEADDGKELLEILEFVRPDVVITDLTMPGMDGFAALAHIREHHPGVRVLVLSMHDSAEAVRRAIRLGAAGYVRKDADGYELELALRSIVRTGGYLGHTEARRLLERPEPTAEEILTPRQIEVLKGLAQGKSSKEIAFELGLSSKTVDVHRTRIMERLSISDIAGLTRYAVRKGLINL